MSDFVSRLERELVAAIEREQRSRPLARLRAPRRAVAALAVAAAIAAVVLALPRAQRDDEPQPAGAVPERLAGDYSRGEVALILDVDRYTLLLPRGERVVGPAGVEGDVLLLWDDGGGPCDSTTEPARYGVRLGGDELRLTLIDDACRARAGQLTAGPLRSGG